MAMKLTDLIEGLPHGEITGPCERWITGVAYDSRRVTPGMVFVALPGLKTHGAQHVATAVERGAVAVVCEVGCVVPRKATKIAVDQPRLALARLASNFHQHPSRHLRLVGITGTNGKTTTAFMVSHLLRSLGLKPGMVGTVRYEIGERMIPAHRTTPEALELQDMLAQMVRTGCDSCVLEVSSHSLEQHRVAQLQFEVAAFTNLTRDHLDYHGDMESYFQTKKRLFQGEAQALCPPKHSVVFMDDPYGKRVADEVDHAHLLTVGMEGQGDLQARQIRSDGRGTLFEVHGSRGSCSVSLPLVGRYNVANAMTALGCVAAMGQDLREAARALVSLPPVPGRLERVEMAQPFLVVVDYAHTADALSHALETLRPLTRGRLLVAFGCGGDRDQGKRRPMGQVAARLADQTWITSDNPRGEDPEIIAAEVLAGYCEVRQEGWNLELDRRTAIDRILRAAREGDTVLLAGKGHETYQEFANTVIPFDDRLYAEETLEDLGFEQVDFMEEAS